jgi:hypothetical protein
MKNHETGNLLCARLHKGHAARNGEARFSRFHLPLRFVFCQGILNRARIVLENHTDHFIERYGSCSAETLESPERALLNIRFRADRPAKRRVHPRMGWFHRTHGFCQIHAGKRRVFFFEQFFLKAASQTLKNPSQTLKNPSQTLKNPSQTLKNPSQTLKNPSQTLKNPSQTLKNPSQTLKNPSQTLKSSGQTL